MIDDAIDRVLALAGDRDGPRSERALLAFQRILLLHLTVRIASGAYVRDPVGPELHIGLSVGLALCFALSWIPRLAPIAVAAAFVAMLALLRAIFPATGNHFYLELWCLGLIVLVGTQDADSRGLLVGAIRWSIAIVLFYTGLQKVLYGTYFEAQFLSFEVATKPHFAQVFAWLMPAEELARIQSIPPNRVGAGPFRSDAPLFLLASNAVYVFELAIPALLLWTRTRRLAVVAVLLFTIAIQSGARELFFGALLVNLILLFWPRDLHARALPAFAAFYAILLAIRWSGGAPSFF